MAVTSFIITNRLRHRVLTDIHLYIYERGGKTCYVSRASSRRPAGADQRTKNLFLLYIPFHGRESKQTVNKSGIYNNIIE